MGKAGFLCDSRAKRLFSAGILNTTEDLGVRGDEVPLYCSGMAPRRPPPDLRYPCRGFRQRPAQRAVFMRGWERDRAAARDLGVVRRASSIGVAQIGGGGGDEGGRLAIWPDWSSGQIGHLARFAIWPDFLAGFAIWADWPSGQISHLAGLAIWADWPSGRVGHLGR